MSRFAGTTAHVSIARRSDPKPFRVRWTDSTGKRRSVAYRWRSVAERKYHLLVRANQFQDWDAHVELVEVRPEPQEGSGA